MERKVWSNRSRKRRKEYLLVSVIVVVAVAGKKMECEKGKKGGGHM